MITIRINEKTCILERGRALSDALAQEGLEHPHFAVALNKKFVSRVHYECTILQEGDCIDIVTPMQGG
jgi:thiamine biosynthesis protein ThiS